MCLGQVFSAFPSGLAWPSFTLHCRKPGTHNQLLAPGEGQQSAAGGAQLLMMIWPQTQRTFYCLKKQLIHLVLLDFFCFSHRYLSVPLWAQNTSCHTHHHLLNVKYFSSSARETVWKWNVKKSSGESAWSSIVNLYDKDINVLKKIIKIKLDKWLLIKLL